MMEMNQKISKIIKKVDKRKRNNGDECKSI
jgi:hypothetical protein